MFLTYVTTNHVLWHLNGAGASVSDIHIYTFLNRDVLEATHLIVLIRNRNQLMKLDVARTLNYRLKRLNTYISANQLKKLKKIFFHTHII